MTKKAKPAEKAETGVAVKGQFDPKAITQNDIPTMLQIVKDKIAAIKTKQGEEEKTDKPFAMFGKIKEIKTVEECVKALSLLNGRKERYEEAAKQTEVDLKKYPYREEGIAYSSWENDIKMRIQYLLHKDELEKYEKVKKELEAHISEEMKFQQSMERVANLLIED